MTSPQGSKLPPNTPSSKDSPTSNFFNNLSPINVISSRLSSQAFDSVDIPSPQPVFATPQNRLIDSKLWRRSQTLFFPCCEKPFTGDADLAATSSEYPCMTRQFIPIAAVQSSNGSEKKLNSGHHPQDEVCRSHSNSVDEFLSIPSEDCENNSCSPGFFLGETDDLVRDKDAIPFSSNGDQMAYPNEDSAQVTEMAFGINGDQMAYPNEDSEQVPVINSSATVTNFVAEYTKQSELVNAELSSNLNVGDQNSSCQLEKDSAKQKPSIQIVPAAFEENEKKGGLLGRKVKAKSNSYVNSISSRDDDPITFDRKLSNHSHVPNTMNFSSMCHVDECPSTSSTYVLGMQDVVSTEYLGKLGGVYEAKCEIPRNSQFHTNHPGISSQISDASGKNQRNYDQEHSRGMYKRLQFEDFEKKEQSIAYAGNCTNLKSPRFMPVTTMISSNMGSSHGSTTNTIAMSSTVQSIQSLPGNISCNYLVKTDGSEQSKGRFTAVVPRSSGIGLHLNTIGMTGEMNGHIDMKMPMEGLGDNGKTFLDIGCEVLSQESKDMMVLRNGAREVSVQLQSDSDDSSFNSMEECNKEKRNKPLDFAPDYHSPLDVEPLDMCMQPEFSVHHITPCSRKGLPGVETSKSEDSAQTSLGKKRKKNPEIEGQKRCSCKRSKCLKLYCDCFAAGMFCNKSCACQGCSNNSENEEMVSSTRQLIEARNPLAFAPKVVHANGDLKESADNKHITPPSARHKRGCNCKKSKCLKKYCECYQAGVGCSLGCRCEGCKNVYGMKEAYGDISEIVVEHQKPEDVLNGESSVEALETVEANNKVSDSEQINTRFTLPIQSVQGTNDSVNGVARLRLPAPESNFAALSSLESPTSAINHTGKCAHGEKSEQTLSIVPYNQQFDSSPGLSVDSLSPGWNEFTSICDISPLSDPSNSSKTKQAKIYYAKLFSDRDTLSGVSFQHCLTATSQGGLGEGKFIINSATGGLQYNPVDETPEILKDAHSPTKTVIASSLNQKRVSPPSKMLHEAGSSFSPGLRSGRKYVLHSIPQFPSLTPYRNN
ncbi:uncharacterized protein LOC110031499 isoform X2 [Phalaenopsis equestris]|uniref:uncharacterized protein LOC110031499 isoform X2 n=1 Tax=Phalaenopsis equestris TaxID=78828 RepID=UPI0009E368A4|nr:uncharacterized protein LOC110031499 isoform X2 [Phalaenopsis equestris]